ncbi:MAG: 2-amino-4-hydroxy-6-hydroxymethyldihydropteridine diphosphokinase [Candidatus Eisenbacteria bacterium]|nr:2-amino-4-hydroxy-6-hydroxymethyldihydropteridine diphosphokinase [Candidatus Eisenbacteria bacterium]
MSVVHLGLGSNLGDRADRLRRALGELAAEGFRPDRLSSLYETEPRGPVTDQPLFLNGAARGLFDGEPRELLEAVRRVESRLGRRRLVDQGPRAIDVDILYFGNRVIDEPPDLVVPHPEIANRRFVLVPLAEIDPNLLHPVLKRSQRELLASTEDRGGVRMLRGEW